MGVGKTPWFVTTAISYLIMSSRAALPDSPSKEIGDEQSSIEDGDDQQNVLTVESSETEVDNRSSVKEAGNGTGHIWSAYAQDPSTIPFGRSDECQRKSVDYEEVRNSLDRVTNTMLDNLECGNGDCTRIVISSHGAPLMRHPPRFGLYELTTIYEGYPVYTRAASKQNLFFQSEFRGWKYAHRIIRWIIGPTVGKSSGGLIVLSEEKCPWKIEFDSAQVFYYGRREHNIWNEGGNGWRKDRSVSIECYDPDKDPVYDCGCRSLNVSSSGIVGKVHSDKMGIYTIVKFTAKIGFLSPVYRKGTEGDASGDLFLYSHHHEGRMWLIGRGYDRWNVRLDLVDIAQRQKPANRGFCPDENPSGYYWEYLSAKAGDEEVWTKDKSMRVECADPE